MTEPKGITAYQRRLSRTFLLYKFFSNLWFMGAVWLYFYRLFITDQQVGILDGLAFAIGLVAEVPSGVLADAIGRDRMVRAGLLFTAGGMFIQALATGFFQLTLGQAVVMIGASCISGADEALFFDKLAFAQNSTHWRALLARASQWTLVGTTLAYMVGGWLSAVDLRLPWVFAGSSFLCSALIIWNVREARVKATPVDVVGRLGEQLVGIRNGFTAFMRPKLRLYVPIYAVVGGLFYAADWGLLRLVLLDRFHFSPFIGSIVVSVSALATVWLLSAIQVHAHRLSEKRVISAVSVVAAVSLLASIFDIGSWGAAVVFTLYAGEYVLQPFMSEVINYRTNEAQRATVLSVASFLRILPYVALAPIIGYLSSHHRLEYFFISWSILIVLAVVTYLSFKKRDAKIEL